MSTEFRRLGIPRNFLTSEVISAQFRRNSAKFRGIPRNFAGIAPEITSVFRGMPKCHFRGHPSCVGVCERVHEGAAEGLPEAGEEHPRQLHLPRHQAQQDTPGVIKYSVVAGLISTVT